MGSALFTLDPSGRITAASPSAHALWQAGAAELVGEAFVSLFEWDIVSDEPDIQDAHWEALRATGEGQVVPLMALPREAPPRPVLVHLQTGAAAGGATILFASVEPAATQARPRPAAEPGLSDAFQLLTQRGTLGFFDQRPSNGEVRFSPAFKLLLGYGDSELADTPDLWARLLHAHDSAASPVAPPSRRAGSGSKPFVREFRLRHKRGHWIWCQCLGVHVLDTDYNLERVCGVLFDISERKEVEEGALAVEERMERLAGSSLMGAFEIDLASGAAWFSTGCQSLLGVGDHLDAQALSHALPVVAAAGGPTGYFGARAGRDAVIELVELHSLDGSRRAALLGCIGGPGSKPGVPRVTGFLCVLTDPALFARTSDGELPPPLLVRATFDALGEAVLLADQQGRVLFANQRAAALVGRPALALHGVPLLEAFHLVHRVSGAVADDAVEEALHATESHALCSEHALVTAGSSTPVPIVWTAMPVSDEKKALAGIVVRFRDPGEMTLTPEELVRANRFESLGLLAGGIAHDFNNLLTTILGGVSLARESRDLSGLENSESACMAAKGLTKQLLAFAKGDTQATRTPTSPGALLRDAAKIAAAGSVSVVTIEADASLPTITIDRGQMLQVFQNLIVNALQAMPDPAKGRVLVQASVIELAPEQVPGLEAGAYVRFDVRDNGSGIAPEHLEKIFDSFFTTKKHGTGLGLATVLSLVRRHGGEIGVASTVGVGTTFTVFLPASSAQVAVEARRAPTLRFGTGRILLMDDDATICELTRAMLESLDYKVDVARHGHDAITFYRRQFNVGKPYDAVLLDLTVIGGMGGEETFTQLKDLDPDVRAIVASGYDDETMAARFLEKGFCGYLAKPYRVTDLARMLKTVLE